MDLAHAAHAERRRVRPARAAPASSSCGSTCTTTSLPGSAPLHRRLDRVRRGVALADGGTRRDADHDVRELPARGVPHPQPPQLDRRVRSPRSRAIAAASASAGARSMSTSTLRLISRAAASSTSTADEERGDRVAAGVAARGRAGARRARRPSRRGRCRSGGRSTRAPRSSSGARRATTPSRGSRRSRSRARSRPSAHQVASTSRPPPRNRRSSARTEMKMLASDEERRLGERGEVLRLPVAVLVPDVRGTRRDADGEERQERGDEVRRRVQRLERSPRLSVASPTESLSATSAAAAKTDPRAARRCGVQPRKLRRDLLERPDDDVLPRGEEQVRLLVGQRDAAPSCSGRSSPRPRWSGHGGWWISAR